jgi:hypothetical protein
MVLSIDKFDLIIVVYLLQVVFRFTTIYSLFFYYQASVAVLLLLNFGRRWRVLLIFSVMIGGPFASNCTDNFIGRVRGVPAARLNIPSLIHILF